MALRTRKNQTVGKAALSVAQTGKNAHPFHQLSSAYPKNRADIGLYRCLRQSVPIIDAAITKLTRLLGMFEVRTDDAGVEKRLRDFLQNVKISPGRFGIDAFIATFFEQLITYGTAVGEMVVTNGKISHLYNADLTDISLSNEKNVLQTVVSTDDGFGRMVPVRYPQLILTCVHAPEPGSAYGTSILQGLPFVSDILLKIYNTIGVNWERVGNVRYCVTYNPQNDTFDKAYAAQRAQQVAQEWGKAMDPNGPVKDFVAVGGVDIKAIGSDIQILDSEIPVRQMLEQIVAKLGVPPFLLGLSWSSTERMSYQQADILTSEIDAYRREITPVIRNICSMWMRLEGIKCDFDIVWDNITLQDITELAKSDYYVAQTEKIRKETGDDEH